MKLCGGGVRFAAMQLYSTPPAVKPSRFVTAVLEKKAFMESLRSAGGAVKDYVSNARIDDPADSGRTALLGALGGAALGGVTNAASRVGVPEEENAKKRSILGSLLMGGLLGGGAGAAAPTLIKAMQGGGKDSPHINVSVNAAAAGGKGGEGGAGGVAGGVAGGAAAAAQPAAARNFEHTPDGKDVTDKMTREQVLGFLKKDTPMRPTGVSSAILGALIPGGIGNLASVAGANPGMVGKGTTLGEKAELVGPGLLAALATGGVVAAGSRGRGIGELLKDPGVRKALGIGYGVNVAANLAGRGMFGAGQDEKYTDAVKQLIPAAFWQNKHVPSVMKMPLMETDAGDLRNNVAELKRNLPEKYLPETYPLLEQL